MAVGDFTKEEAGVVEDCISEMFDAIPKSRRMEYLGHLNEVLCFVAAAKRNAPTEDGESE